MWTRLLDLWKKGHRWWKAALVAFGLLLFLHVFVLRWVAVHSTSMYATLLPGDLLGVQRWPVWTGFQRGDIAVFRDPLQDRSLMVDRQLLVKRIVGLPGDRVELRAGELRVNGEVVHYPGETHSYLVRLGRGTDREAFLHALGDPPSFLPPERGVVEMALNGPLAKELEQRTEVVAVEPMGLATGAPRHIFPFSPFHKWNGDNFGPIHVPARGDTVPINAATVPLYDRIISRYEGHRIGTDGNDLLIDGEIATRYVIAQDHYFVLGDSRHASADSRYWGFVPADHLVGRAGFVLLSRSGKGVGWRSGRTLLGL